MKRFQTELNLMVRRARTEFFKHYDRVTGQLNTPDCDCFQGPGAMRKHRPHESCGGHCTACAAEAGEKRGQRRKARYEGRREAQRGPSG